MKKAIIIIAFIIIVAAFGAYYFFKTGHHLPSSNKPNATLQELKEGNVRFVSDKSKNLNYSQILKSKNFSSHAKAVVLNCTGSPDIPTIIFDQKIGEIDTIRVAGNVINPDILGTMEYATKENGASLIIVLGHSNCSIVEAACKDKKLGHLTNILQQIQPAVKKAEASMKNHRCTDAKLINAISKQNVINMMKAIPQNSPIIADLIKSGRVKIVGGIYNNNTGAVVFTTS